MTELGANPAQLDDLAALFSGMAGDLSHRRLTLTAWIEGDRFWRGSRANEFRHEWATSYAPQIARVCDYLNSAVTCLHDNANQQRVASGESPRDYGGSSFLDKLFGGAVHEIEHSLGRLEADIASNPTLDAVMAGLSGIVGASAAELHSIASLLPRLEPVAKAVDKFGSRFLGPVAFVIDGAKLVKDELKTNGPISDDAMNDQLNMGIDAITTLADVDPLTGALMGTVATGVVALEMIDRKLTADVYRLSNPFAEAQGVIVNDIMRGDYSPVDMAVGFAKGEGGALADITVQATHGVEHVGHAIVSGIGRFL